EKEALKAAVTNKLLAQAFATRRDFLIWCNTDKNIVGISVTSAKRAERA
ncbi:MAG TPA: recombination-associated protein RdgC, partial [Succinivibrio sp.]|nr:recombination-associated protein RdgC [Succinivibrio sp.]